MRIDVFSIFPEWFAGPLDASLLGRARADGRLDVRVHDPRGFTTDRHRSVDDAPYGGGAGMVMAPGPLFDAVEAVDPPRPLLLLSAAGRRFDQAFAAELAAGSAASPSSAAATRASTSGWPTTSATASCRSATIVLAGGEVAAAGGDRRGGTRLLPGVMGNEESAGEESFAAGLLEYPQYTRPPEFRGHAVPEVLRSGDHARIARWRRAQSLHRTLARRPDLLAGRPLSEADEALLREFRVGPADRARPANIAGSSIPELSR